MYLLKEGKYDMNSLPVDDNAALKFINLHPDLWLHRDNGHGDFYFGTQNNKKGRFEKGEWNHERELKNSLGYICRRQTQEKVESLNYLSKLLKLGLIWDHSQNEKFFLGVGPQEIDLKLITEIVAAVFCEDPRDDWEVSVDRGTGVYFYTVKEYRGPARA